MTEQINILSIMETITGVKQGKCTDAEAAFLTDYPDGYIPTMNEARKNLIESRRNTAMDYIRINKDVSYYREISGNRIKVFIKRVIRKLIRFCSEPQISDQNRINENILKVLDIQNSEIRVLRSELAELQSHNRQTEDKNE